MPAMFGCWLGQCNHGVHNNYRHDKVRCNEIRHNWAPAVIIANCAATRHHCGLVTWLSSDHRRMSVITIDQSSGGEDAF